MKHLIPVIICASILSCSKEELKAPEQYANFLMKVNGKEVKGNGLRLGPEGTYLLMTSVQLEPQYLIPGVPRQLRPANC